MDGDNIELDLVLNFLKDVFRLKSGNINHKILDSLFIRAKCENQMWERQHWNSKGCSLKYLKLFLGGKKLQHFQNIHYNSVTSPQVLPGHFKKFICRPFPNKKKYLLKLSKIFLVFVFRIQVFEVQKLLSIAGDQYQKISQDKNDDDDDNLIVNCSVIMQWWCQPRPPTHLCNHCR